MSNYLRLPTPNVATKRLRLSPFRKADTEDAMKCIVRRVDRENRDRVSGGGEKLPPRLFGMLECKGDHEEGPKAGYARTDRK